MELVLSDMQVDYRGSATPAVKDVSFTVRSGSNVGLIGESGGGKSSIARAIVGLTRITSGTVTLDGATIARPGARPNLAMRRKVQMVFQDASASLNPRMTIREAVNEGCRVTTRDRDLPGKAKSPEDYMDLVGLPTSWGDRYPHQLSGGQRQRVALARVLAIRPELVILDEATSALDVSVQASILRLLKDLQRDLEITYLVITHDLAVVSYLCHRLLVMYSGQIVEEGSVQDVLDAPRHPYTRILRDSVPSIHGSPTSTAATPAGPLAPPNASIGCPFAAHCPIGPFVRPDRDQCLTVRPPLADEVACHFPLGSEQGYDRGFGDSDRMWQTVPYPPEGTESDR